MRFLHTSDWHLGRSLFNKHRYDEFDAFLNWMVNTIQEHAVDALIIAGDIFDTTTPSNRAQAQYFDFLNQVGKQSNCRHIIIIGGNHDSPTFLNAPQQLLKRFNIHVVGCMGNHIQDELIELKHNNQVEALVCAVPYLRDRDIRTVSAGESFEDKQSKLIEGLKSHYAELCQYAVARREAIYAEQGTQRYIPIIGTGHLFAAGGTTLDGDGVRELYVGNLAHTGSDAFPRSLDYVALGHLHVPQLVNKDARIRYSGSPIPMGFGEAKQQKIAILIDTPSTTQETIKQTDLAIPCFQKLVQIKGDLNTIEAELKVLVQENRPIWLEIEYHGAEIIANLRERLEMLTHDTMLEILRLKNNRISEQVLTQQHIEDTLENLDVYQVFERCLEAHDIPATQHDALKASYREIVHTLEQTDHRAE